MSAVLKPLSPPEAPELPRERLRSALREARERERAGGAPLADALAQALDCTRESALAHLGRALHLPVLSLEAMREAEADFTALPFGEAKKRLCLVLRGPGGALLAAVGDPFNNTTREWLEERIREPLSWVLAHPRDIEALLTQLESGHRALAAAEGSTGGPGATRETVQDLSVEGISDTESPVIKLVSSTLYDALNAGASDIHLETDATGLTVKYRIDGVLSVASSFAGQDLADQVISRVKVISELDISERRLPQDGRFKARSKGREIDFRVSVMPSVFGEDAVLRILDKRALADEARGLTLDQLGFNEKTLRSLRRLSADPYGMLLVTGPTGSGKTTTLYAAITEINKGRDKIITIEDPVEYQLPGILQIPVNDRKGLSFARGLRSILRHDPDRIMVGEIRDPETAEIAVQSALTGHLVYTTVHANSVFDVIGRFLHMGVDPYNFVSALNAVLAQRLLRINCKSCLEPETPSTQRIEDAGIPLQQAATFRFMRGRGCAECRGSGYRGRRAIGELMVMNDRLRRLVLARAEVQELKEAARAAGTVTLRECALDLVRSGETTLDEIDRVTFVG